MTTSTLGAPDAVGAADPLDQLRQVLLRRAQAAADALRADAERAARTLTDAAQQEAAAALERARADGAADAEQRQAEDQARTHREARGIVLAAQRAAFEELRAAARAAVGQLLADPGRRRRLVALVRTELGSQAQVRPHPSGGVVGEAPDGRRVDASVDALVEQSLGRLDLGPLWATS